MFAERGFVRIVALGTRSFAIGRGHSFADLPARLLVRRGPNGSVSRILALDQSGSRIAQIWPPYQKQILRQGERFVVATAVGRAEDRAARALLMREHREGAAAHGLLLCLYALDADKNRELVGVAQIGEYYHARPCGRDAFSRRINGARFRELGRGEEIKTVPIASAKRFVVAAHRQGEGLGQVLARHALRTARDYRWPSARVVEVIRHQSARAFLAICCQSKRDFLTRSGYVPVPRAEWMRNGQIIINVAAIPATRIVAGYYYADLTDAERSRFIERARAAHA